MEEIKEIIKESFLLKNVDKDIADNFLLNNTDFEIKKFYKNEIILNGKSDKFLGIVIHGTACIISNENGVILRNLKERNIFGVANIFTTPEYTTEVVALSECEIICLSKKFVLNCISLDKQVVVNYIEFLSAKINFLNTKINAFTEKNVESKVYTYFLQLSNKAGRNEFKVNYSSVAKDLGIGRASLYRSVSRLSCEGLIEKFGNTISIKEGKKI